MQQKDLLAYLHNFIQRNETKDTADIFKKRDFKPEVPNLDKNTEDALKALCDSVKKYNIPNVLLLHSLAERLDPDDQSILNVLRDPNPANVNALIDAAKRADEDYVEKNGSIANLFKEGALTCVYVVRCLLVCLLALIVLPPTLLGSCFSSTSCFNSNSASMKYCEYIADTLCDIKESAENTEDAYEALTYDSNFQVANHFIGFFKPKSAQPEAALGANLTLLNIQPLLAPQGF